MAVFYTCFVLGVVMLVVRDVVGKCNGGTVNGCSVPISKFPYKETFRLACNRHDVCYGCGAKSKISRLSCDTRFKMNMNQICKRMQGLVKRLKCAAMSSTYYTAVRKFGVLYYRYFRTESYCGQSWVKGCL